MNSGVKISNREPFSRSYSTQYQPDSLWSEQSGWHVDYCQLVFGFMRQIGKVSRTQLYLSSSVEWRFVKLTIQRLSLRVGVSARKCRGTEDSQLSSHRSTSADSASDTKTRFRPYTYVRLICSTLRAIAVTQDRPLATCVPMCLHSPAFLDRLQPD